MNNIPQWAKIAFKDLEKTRELRCKFCYQLNRVKQINAILTPEAYQCANCSQPLFRKKDEPLSLASKPFEHIEDASTLRNLRSIPGISTMLKFFFKNFNERAYLHQLRANTVECGPNQYARLFHIVSQATKTMGYEKSPTIFLNSSPLPNAFTTGGDEGILVFSSSLVNTLNDEELLFAAGHELGHLLSEHAVYRMLALIILQGGINMMPISIAAKLIVPLRAALMRWIRFSEFSADRAGLLACKSPETAITALLKLSSGCTKIGNENNNINIQAFIEQIKKLENSDENLVDDIIQLILVRGQTHPMIAWRVSALLDWVWNGDYLELLI